MYKAIHSGSSQGKSGVIYQYSPGSLIECSKEELQHVDGLIWIEPETEIEIEYPKAGKAGWFELSNGSKVRGEEEAKKAQAEL